MVVPKELQDLRSPHTQYLACASTLGSAAKHSAAIDVHCLVQPRSPQAGEAVVLDQADDQNIVLAVAAFLPESERALLFSRSAQTLCHWHLDWEEKPEDPACVGCHEIPIAVAAR